MIHKDVKKWVKELPCCHSEQMTKIHKRELDNYDRCGGCGRANNDYIVKIRANDQVKVWTDKDDTILALIHNGDLVVFSDK